MLLGPDPVLNVGVFGERGLAQHTVTGEHGELGERAGWRRGGAAGGLGAGARSGAAGRFAASGRAASGDGHACWRLDEMSREDLSNADTRASARRAPSLPSAW